MSRFQFFFYLGIALLFIGVVFAIAYAGNSTNSTTEMQFGDRWTCGYINTTTTLESLRDCFRD